MADLLSSLGPPLLLALLVPGRVLLQLVLPPVLLHALAEPGEAADRHVPVEGGGGATVQATGAALVEA